MADVICRWRNATPQTVVELVNAMPHEEMASQSFHDFMINTVYGASFFRTSYQLACQLGLYYDDGETYHPRFNYDINEDEATIYLQKWIHRYYAPNPYTKSLKTLENPILLVESIVRNIEEKGNRNLKDILEELFKDDMGNLDIIQNLLNNYSSVISTDSNGQVSLKENYKEYMEKVIDKNDKEAFFHSFDEKKNIKTFAGSLQQIYYGAPGTGKSYELKRLTEGEDVVRTTFHPDSDYSTFVGCYKPTMKKTGVKNPVGNEVEHIVYTFVPQAFLLAYVKAWKKYAEAGEDETKKQFLVIEEINRGNCAQIFGDLFQLLDRNEYGFSEYYIHADNDMKRYLSNELMKLKEKITPQKDKIIACCKEDVVDKVFDGEILLLPDNLYIWATMNTSDQSLFPIDSAFKRRWDWEYVPIANVKEKNWKIVVGDKEYGWWDFLEKINEQIGATTNSEDKKLGFFFCQANGDGLIDAKTFINKVLFYLWNDVFKDYGLEGDLFKTATDEILTFDKFFTKDSETNLQHWLDKLIGIKQEEAPAEETQE